MGRTPTLADEFIEFIANSTAQGRAPFLHYIDDSGVLRFQLSTAFEHWRRSRRAGNAQTLERTAIAAQLEERFLRGPDEDNRGQYIVPPTVLRNAWYYGISLTNAFESGLDVPSVIEEHTMRINF